MSCLAVYNCPTTPSYLFVFKQRQFSTNALSVRKLLMKRYLILDVFILVNTIAMNNVKVYSSDYQKARSNNPLFRSKLRTCILMPDLHCDQLYWAVYKKRRKLKGRGPIPQNNYLLYIKIGFWHQQQKMRYRWNSVVLAQLIHTEIFLKISALSCSLSVTLQL